MAEATCAWCAMPTAGRMYCDKRCQNRAAEDKVRKQQQAAREGRTCFECSAPIPVSVREGCKWCSQTCKGKNRAREARAKRHAAMFGEAPRLCTRCGAAIPSNANGHRLFCGPQCLMATSNARATQRERASKQPSETRLEVCEPCGQLFLTNRATRRYCSPGCRLPAERAQSTAKAREKERAAARRRLQAKSCAWCDGPMTHLTYAGAKFCGARCRAAATYDRHRDQHKSYRDRTRRGDEWRAVNRTYGQRRRARLVEATTANLSLADIDLRMTMFSGCWMCGGEWTEIEHVKPLSKDGAHLLANLRPSCGPCNRRKAATWEGVVHATTWRCAPMSRRRSDGVLAERLAG